MNSIKILVCSLQQPLKPGVQGWVENRRVVWKEKLAHPDVVHYSMTPPSLVQKTRAKFTLETLNQRGFEFKKMRHRWMWGWVTNILKRAGLGGCQIEVLITISPMSVLCLVAQSCPTLCDPMDCSPPCSSVHRDSPGKNTAVGCHALLQGIFPTQRSNSQLLHFLHWHVGSLPAEPARKPKMPVSRY